MSSHRSVFIGSGGGFGRANAQAGHPYVAADVDAADALVVTGANGRGNGNGNAIRMTRERFTIARNAAGRLVVNTDNPADPQIRISRRETSLNERVLVEALTDGVIVSGERVAEGQATLASLPADIRIGPSRIELRSARTKAYPAWLTTGVPAAIVVGGLVGWLVPSMLTDVLNLFLSW